MIPIQACEFEEKDSEVIIHYYEKNPTFIEKIFFKKFLKIPQKVDLDKIGSLIWLNLDGKRNVDELINIVKNNFPNEENLENRVKLFITQLFKNKFIQLFRKT